VAGKSAIVTKRNVNANSASARSRVAEANLAVAAKSVAAANKAAVSKAADDKPCPSVNKRREATPAVFLSVRGAQVRRSSAAIISVNPCDYLKIATLTEDRRNLIAV
jgi:hypothetical protein